MRGAKSTAHLCLTFCSSSERHSGHTRFHTFYLYIVTKNLKTMHCVCNKRQESDQIINIETQWFQQFSTMRRFSRKSIYHGCEMLPQNRIEKWINPENVKRTTSKYCNRFEFYCRPGSKAFIPVQWIWIWISIANHVHAPFLCHNTAYKIWILASTVWHSLSYSYMLTAYK